MCIAYIALGVNTDWPLIIAANRDEFHARPALAARPWPNEPAILAGLDVRAGGTWLGLEREHGRLALLTNYREPLAAPEPGRRSRGELIPQFLRERRPPAAFLQELHAQDQHYAGFNLFVLQWPTASSPMLAGYYSNRHPQGHPMQLDAGTRVLSNEWLDSPWPKSQYLKNTLDASRFDGSDQAVEALFDALRHDRPAPDAQLPRTGLSLERERLLSSPFIISPEYGTRCSTVIVVDKHGRGLLRERSFAPDATLTRQHDWYFQWPATPTEANWSGASSIVTTGIAPKPDPVRKPSSIRKETL
ncbi:MAG TPA: NRDE family protein [Alcaligenes sp.]|nr:NRDE family protein [Alcaligenes sp.]HRL27056.1 NRDE family protein [Alcaligenes sp.]